MILFAAEKAGLQFPGRCEPVFSDLSLTIRKGDNLRLTGPSGSGKTSLMRMIAGLERPTTGRVLALPQNTGMAFAEPRLLPHLSVLENLLFIAPEAGRDARSMLDAVNIPDLADKSAASLSKGQAQRVALLRALLARPDILLLDEAFGGLDTRVWQVVRDLVFERANRDGLALVEISHDPARLLSPNARSIFLG